MKRKLQSIAAQLSEDDIQEIIRIKKTSDKRSVSLMRKRDKLAAQLAALDAELAKIAGKPVAAATTGKRRGRKPGVKAATAEAATAKTGKKKVATRGRKASAGRRNNFSAAVREVFSQAGSPLKASQVVDGLPTVGVKVKDVSDMRKRVSVVLAQHKNYFEQVERGVYRLRD